MSTPFPRRLTWLLALTGLLGGCHSAKPSFTFHSAASTSVAEAAVPAAAAPVPAATPPAVAAASAGPAAARPTRPVAAAPAGPTAARQLRPAPWRQALRPRPVARHQASRQPVRPRSESGPNTFHIVLGAVLIVSSIVVGLWLGGWLGLGVGAAIMLLGDYFLVLGIGGKHAWLEIFQEFFNM
ncbi:hypothetical protein [Hymenobacter sp. CRA2]|uniref:hypothetical protein n=1 Tax=Hymenobacter sp. CRA2 TaxID=1955620 RepID=UPI0009C9E554|nr:hypothetical protein [Hymenobacter sp. CRA2]OON68276.1 hypothetical protein B0919_14075 [Hymenobacter sp. CRA2]